MVLLLIIICSLLIFHSCNNQIVRLLCISFSSLIIYYHFVGENIVYVLSLIAITLLFRKLRNEQLFNNSYLLPLYICLSILIFLLGKFNSICSLILPIGYSVVMFSGISLMIDEKKSNHSYTILETLAYLLFFPKILAGPIERMEDFNKQLKATDKILIKNDIYVGIKIIVFGAFLKYVVTDTIFPYANIDYKGINQFLSIILYALLFYLDFWAYSLLAVGFAKLYGINITLNFDNPYSAISFKDFWNRWNISLTNWLKDYVFIPLQKKARTSRSINVFIVFIISALWHGFNFPFLLWGISHAALNIIEKNRVISRLKTIRLYNVFVILICSMLWQTFRFDNITDVVNVYLRIFTPENINVTILVILSITILLVFVFERRNFKYYIMEIEGFRKKHIITEVSIITIMILALLFVNTNLNSPFHYFKY